MALKITTYVRNLKSKAKRTNLAVIMIFQGHMMNANEMQGNMMSLLYNEVDF